ncbi:amine oxidase [Scenedesmus sp. NREL 46B-D3]|nr:amine oxidase [Scenedesmus sp. NREL 46B-D3]
MQLSAHSTRAIAQERRVHAAARPAAPRAVALAAAHMTPALQQQALAPSPCCRQGPNRAPQRTRRSVAAAAGNVPSEVLDTVVVGAGISGLVTAQALQTKHGDKVQSFLVTEGRERVGGNITSLQGDGYIWEEGPNSFQPNDAMLQAAVDAGVDKDLVFGDPTAPRFVFWQKKLRATPSGPDALTFDLLSIWGKIRAGLGAVGIVKGGPMPEYEESVEQFIRRNLGDEVFERLIEPFCSGVYAGNPSKLSMKAAFQRIWILEKDGGSLVGGAIKLFQNRKKNPPAPRDPRLPPKPKGQTVGSFNKGLRVLTDAIGAKLQDKIRVNWKLTSISTTSEGLYKLTYDTPEGAATLTTRSVAMTIPAWALADLLKEQAPAASQALASFDYPPVGAVTLAYPVAAVREDRKAADGSVPGFGQLHPRSQGVTTLGTIYSSSLFPGRCPNGEMLLLNYIGGATNRSVKDASQEELVAQVDKDLRTMLLKPDAPQPRVVGVRVWPRAIPQFNVGHLDTLDAAKQGLKAAGLDGVLLGGNYVAGVALGKCVEYGFEFAEQVGQYVQAAAPAKQKVSA